MLKVGIEANGLTTRKNLTGLQRYLHCLVANVAMRAEQENLCLYLYCIDRPVAKERFATLISNPFVKWRYAPFARGWWRVGMGLMMQLDRLDVFHFPSPHMATYCPVPAVVTFHDLAALSLDTDLARKERFYLPDARDAGERAAALIAVSNSARDEVAKYLGRRDVTIIQEGVDQTHFKPVAHAVEKTRAELGVTQYILCVGTLQTRKNHIRLIQAFEQIQDRIPHHLVIVGGKGSGAAEVLTYIDEHPNSRVHLMGYVDDELLPYLYTAADVFALPSLWEGFGLPLIEAMACGAPVLTSNAPALTEVVGDAALIADPYSVDDIAMKLWHILTDHKLREHLIKLGYARADMFSWEQSAAQTIAVYKQVNGML